MVREKVSRYAKSFSLNEMKIVYFEEADKLTVEAQNALKDLIDKVNNITKLFFVCYDNKNILDPIKSRCIYKLTLDDSQYDKIFEHLSYILKQENVLYKESDIEYAIDENYPDIRSMIGFIESNIIDDIFLVSHTVEPNGEMIKKLEKRRESDRVRYNKWKDKQKQAGKKQISAMISEQAYNILKSIDSKSQSQVIDELLLTYKDNKNQN